jgi:hypothetical protein
LATPGGRIVSDIFTETTSRGWFSRIASSFVGILFGFIMLLAMIVLLFWNEGRAVQTAQSLAEGAGAVVSVAADAVDPANDGKIIHVTGDVRSDEAVRDPDFGIEASGVRLVRQAEMYQWVEQQKSETRTKLGGGEETVTTYSYARGWDDEPQDSASFKQPQGHANPEMRWRDRSFALSTAEFGARTLDVHTLSRIGGSEALAVKPSDAATVEQTFGWAKTSVVGGQIYVGDNPASPKIGDQRISYELVPLGAISVIAQQTGNGLTGYQTRSGDLLFLVDRGNVPAAKMFADAVSANNVITWVVRAAGILFLAVAFALVMGPIGVILDVIPFFGSLARIGTGIVAVILAIAVGTLVIALAWFWYRPILSLAILAAGAFAVWLLSRYARSRTPEAQTAPA